MPLDGKNYQPCENARILREAANLLREKGWTKWVEHSKHGFCIGGAVLYIENDKDDTSKNIYAAKFWSASPSIEVICEYKKFEDHFRLIKWNNQPERTKEEVIAALEGAAIFAEEKVTT